MQLPTTPTGSLVSAIGGGLTCVNLGGERLTPIAEALRERGAPFALATGYDGHHLPEAALTSATHPTTIWSPTLSLV